MAPDRPLAGALGLSLCVSLAWSARAPAGAISSSGIQMPVVYTCETLPGPANAARWMRFEVGYARSGANVGRMEMRLVEATRPPAPRGAFPVAVEASAVGTTSTTPTTRYLGAEGSVRLDLHFAPKGDFFAATHLGHLAFDAPFAPEGFIAFVACSARVDTFAGSAP